MRRRDFLKSILASVGLARVYPECSLKPDEKVLGACTTNGKLLRMINDEEGIAATRSWFWQGLGMVG